jgi:hypothetical protein
MFVSMVVLLPTMEATEGIFGTTCLHPSIVEVLIYQIDDDYEIKISMVDRIQSQT